MKTLTMKLCKNLGVALVLAAVSVSAAEASDFPPPPLLNASLYLSNNTNSSVTWTVSSYASGSCANPVSAGTQGCSLHTSSSPGTATVKLPDGVSYCHVYFSAHAADAPRVTSESSNMNCYFLSGGGNHLVVASQ